MQVTSINTKLAHMEAEAFGLLEFLIKTENTHAEIYPEQKLKYQAIIHITGASDINYSVI